MEVLVAYDELALRRRQLDERADELLNQYLLERPTQVPNARAESGPIAPRRQR